MLRQALLFLSNQPHVHSFVSHNRIAKRFASRFVAGESLPEALDAVASLNQRRIHASLDLLGESVRSEADARAAGRAYIALIDRIHQRQLDSNVSVKLTALGLDMSEELCTSVMHDILDRARQCGQFVRIDMESSAYTERTLRLFEDRFFPSYAAHVGVVLQSYLYRTQADVERMIALRARVRLCKGAYNEPATVAYPEKRDVDANYHKCMHLLLTDGVYPGIATHDEAMLTAAMRHVREQGIDSSRFEFQMLYGVRRDLQDRVVREGFNLRVYVPFGTQWYPYFMRRLAERPANVAFVAGNVMREMVRRR